MKDQYPLLIDELETLIQKTLPEGMDLKIVARSLAEQFQQEIDAAVRKDSESQQCFAPDQYSLSLNPEDLNLIIPQPVLTQEKLSTRLQAILEQHNYTIARKLHITLATDPTLARGELRLIGWHSSNPLLLKTESDVSSLNAPQGQPENAFLIVDGTRKISLPQGSFSIGRRMDNDLTLEDLHISRSHARIEQKDDGYHIFDCDSKAGIYLNQRPVRQAHLRPGDLITIGRYQLIYGEGEGAPDLQTSPLHKDTTLSQQETVPASDQQMRSRSASTRPIDPDSSPSNNQITYPNSSRPSDLLKPSDK
jgi:hypothetical protein